MSADYTPGSFAVVTFRSDDMRKAETWPGIRWSAGWLIVDRRGNYELIHDRNVTDARPFVALDPDDHKQVERFTEELFVAGLVIDGTTYDSRDVGGTYRAGMADRVREALLTQTKPQPPKPPEPQGLGAVVEDTEGRHYVRHCPGDCEDGGLCIPWHRVTDALNRTYDEFDAARVLSDGWEPKP